MLKVVQFLKLKYIDTIDLWVDERFILGVVIDFSGWTNLTHIFHFGKSDVFTPPIKFKIRPETNYEFRQEIGDINLFENFRF